MTSKLLQGCSVHWARSYQHVAARVSAKYSAEMKLKVHEAFECIAQAMPKLANANEVRKCIAALRGNIAASSIATLVPKLTEDHISAAEVTCSNWSITKAWVNWRPCYGQLVPLQQMLLSG